MGQADDGGQLPDVTSARVKPEENGQSAAARASTGGGEPGRSPAFAPVTEEDVTALEESVCENDYGSPQQQAIAGNLAQREQDRELIAKLAENRFQGKAQEQFEAELAAYGYPVMMAWTRTGEIVKKTAERGRPLFISGNGLGWARDDRSELASETVAKAVDFFREKVLRAGTWDHNRGATIKTYFVGACLFQFPNVYDRWQRERRRWDAYPAVSIDDPGARELLRQMHSGDDVEHSVAVRDQLQRTLAELAEKYPDLYQVVMMWQEGHTDAQAAMKLGVTSRAIEGRWHRFRRTGNRGPT